MSSECRRYEGHYNSSIAHYVQFKTLDQFYDEMKVGEKWQAVYHHDYKGYVWKGTEKEPQTFICLHAVPHNICRFCDKNGERYFTTDVCQPAEYDYESNYYELIMCAEHGNIFSEAWMMFDELECTEYTLDQYLGEKFK